MYDWGRINKRGEIIKNFEQTLFHKVYKASPDSTTP